MADEAGTGAVGEAGSQPTTQTGDSAGAQGVPSGASSGSGAAEGGTFDLKAVLGEELASDRNISKFLENENPVQAMAKSLLEAQKMAGRVKIGVPGDKATPEERAAFFKELGVPEDEKGYEFTRPEGIPEEAWSEENAAKWAKLMRENNVPKSAAQALRTALMQETLEGVQKANDSLNAALDKDFGEQKQVVAKEIGDLMAKSIPDADVRKNIDAAINDKDRPAFALALGHALQYMKKTYGLSDTNAGDGGNGAGKSIDDLRADAKKLMASPAYRDGLSKEHDDVVKQVNGLYKTIGDLTAAAGKK